MSKWEKTSLIIFAISFVIFSLIGFTLPGWITSLIAIFYAFAIPIIIFIIIIKAIKKYLNYKKEQLQVQKDILTELRKEKAE